MEDHHHPSPSIPPPSLLRELSFFYNGGETKCEARCFPTTTLIEFTSQHLFPMQAPSSSTSVVAHTMENRSLQRYISDMKKSYVCCTVAGEEIPWETPVHMVQKHVKIMVRGDPTAEVRIGVPWFLGNAASKSGNNRLHHGSGTHTGSDGSTVVSMPFRGRGRGGRGGGRRGSGGNVRRGGGDASGDRVMTPSEEYFTTSSSSASVVPTTSTVGAPLDRHPSEDNGSERSVEGRRGGRGRGGWKGKEGRGRGRRRGIGSGRGIEEEDEDGEAEEGEEEEEEEEEDDDEETQRSTASSASMGTGEGEDDEEDEEGDEEERDDEEEEEEAEEEEEGKERGLGGAAGSTGSNGSGGSTGKRRRRVIAYRTKNVLKPARTTTTSRSATRALRGRPAKGRGRGGRRAGASRGTPTAPLSTNTGSPSPPSSPPVPSLPSSSADGMVEERRRRRRLEKEVEEGVPERSGNYPLSTALPELSLPKRRPRGRPPKSSTRAAAAARGSTEGGEDRSSSSSHLPHRHHHHHAAPAERSMAKELSKTSLPPSTSLGEDAKGRAVGDGGSQRSRSGSTSTVSTNGPASTGSISSSTHQGEDEDDMEEDDEEEGSKEKREPRREGGRGSMEERRERTSGTESESATSFLRRALVEEDEKRGGGRGVEEERSDAPWSPSALRLEDGIHEAEETPRGGGSFTDSVGPTAETTISPALLPLPSSSLESSSSPGISYAPSSSMSPLSYASSGGGGPKRVAGSVEGVPLSQDSTTQVSASLSPSFSSSLSTSSPTIVFRRFTTAPNSPVAPTLPMHAAPPLTEIPMRSFFSDPRRPFHGSSLHPTADVPREAEENGAPVPNRRGRVGVTHPPQNTPQWGANPRRLAAAQREKDWLGMAMLPLEVVHPQALIHTLEEGPPMWPSPNVEVEPNEKRSSSVLLDNTREMKVWNTGREGKGVGTAHDTREGEGNSIASLATAMPPTSFSTPPVRSSLSLLSRQIWELFAPVFASFPYSEDAVALVNAWYRQELTPSILLCHPYSYLAVPHLSVYGCHPYVWEQKTSSAARRLRPRRHTSRVASSISRKEGKSAAEDATIKKEPRPTSFKEEKWSRIKLENEEEEEEGTKAFGVEGSESTEEDDDDAEEERGTSRKSSVVLPIIVGGCATLVNPASKDASHQWTVYIRGLYPSFASIPVPPPPSSILATATTSTTQGMGSIEAAQVRAPPHLSTTPVEKGSKDGMDCERRARDVTNVDEEEEEEGAKESKGAPVPFGGGSSALPSSLLQTRGTTSFPLHENEEAESVMGEDYLSYFIEKVTFILDRSFTPCIRTVYQPPFEITEVGWGEFMVSIHVHLRYAAWTRASQPEREQVLQYFCGSAGEAVLSCSTGGGRHSMSSSATAAAALSSAYGVDPITHLWMRNTNAPQGRGYHNNFLSNPPDARLVHNLHDMNANSIARSLFYKGPVIQPFLTPSSLDWPCDACRPRSAEEEDATNSTCSSRSRSSSRERSAEKCEEEREFETIKEETHDDDDEEEDCCLTTVSSLSSRNYVTRSGRRGRSSRRVALSCAPQELVLLRNRDSRDQFRQSFPTIRCTKPSLAFCSAAPATRVGGIQKREEGWEDEEKQGERVPHTESLRTSPASTPPPPLLPSTVKEEEEGQRGVHVALPDVPGTAGRLPSHHSSRDPREGVERGHMRSGEASSSSPSGMESDAMRRRRNLSRDTAPLFSAGEEGQEEEEERSGRSMAMPFSSRERGSSTASPPVAPPFSRAAAGTTSSGAGRGGRPVTTPVRRPGSFSPSPQASLPGSPAARKRNMVSLEIGYKENVVVLSHFLRFSERGKHAPSIPPLGPDIRSGAPVGPEQRIGYAIVSGPVVTETYDEIVLPLRTTGRQRRRGAAGGGRNHSPSPLPQRQPRPPLAATCGTGIPPSASSTSTRKRRREDDTQGSSIMSIPMPPPGASSVHETEERGLHRRMTEVEPLLASPVSKREMEGEEGKRGEDAMEGSALADEEDAEVQLEGTTMGAAPSRRAEEEEDQSLLHAVAAVENRLRSIIHEVLKQPPTAAYGNRQAGFQDPLAPPPLAMPAGQGKRRLNGIVSCWPQIAAAPHAAKKELDYAFAYLSSVTATAREEGWLAASLQRNREVLFGNEVVALHQGRRERETTNEEEKTGVHVHDPHHPSLMRVMPSSSLPPSSNSSSLATPPSPLDVVVLRTYYQKQRGPPGEDMASTLPPRCLLAEEEAPKKSHLACITALDASPPPHCCSVPLTRIEWEVLSYFLLAMPESMAGDGQQLCRVLAGLAPYLAAAVYTALERSCQYRLIQSACFQHAPCPRRCHPLSSSLLGTMTLAQGRNETSETEGGENYRTPHPFSRITMHYRSFVCPSCWLSSSSSSEGGTPAGYGSTLVRGRCAVACYRCHSDIVKMHTTRFPSSTIPTKSGPVLWRGGEGEDMVQDSPSGATLGPHSPMNLKNVVTLPLPPAVPPPSLATVPHPFHEANIRHGYCNDMSQLIRMREALKENIYRMRREIQLRQVAEIAREL